MIRRDGYEKGGGGGWGVKYPDISRKLSLITLVRPKKKMPLMDHGTCGTIRLIKNGMKNAEMDEMQTRGF